MDNRRCFEWVWGGGSDGQIVSIQKGMSIPRKILGDVQRWSRGHKARGQGQGQGHKKNPRPRPGMLEAKAKDQRHKRKCSPKKKEKKVFTKIFQAISTKKRFPKNFSSAPQNFNNSKNTADLKPRTGQFSRT